MSSNEAQQPDASTSKRPLYQPEYTASTLVEALRSVRKSDPKKVQVTTYNFQREDNGQLVPIQSWKTPEHLYRNAVENGIPCSARGLFTVEDSEGGHRIVSRGYDKFHNLTEVPYLEWSQFPESTSGPYYMTLKSNGCLILISALDPTTLLVTSKHSLGPALEGKLSHAEAGRQWLNRHLEKSGHSCEELAAELFTANLTAVAELCDDSFEEHVLPYPPHLTGLHLHGLNLNTPSFSTLPPFDVTNFATRYGFIATRHLAFPDVPSLKAFVDEATSTGEWEGEQVEGFVVRCKVAPENDKESAQIPYRPGTDFFFKIKFEEPYLMWRNWREITKILVGALLQPPPGPPTQKELDLQSATQVPAPELTTEVEVVTSDLQATYLDPVSGESNDPISKLSKKQLKAAKAAASKKWRAENQDIMKAKEATKAVPHKSADGLVPSNKLQDPTSLVYEDWCRTAIADNPDWFADIKLGKGIVFVRERFLEWLDTEEGKAKLGDVKNRWVVGGSKGSKKRGEGQTYSKTLLIPIAVPGCGKTALGVALSSLYGFCHVQSDDVTTKNTGPTFMINIKNEFKKHDIVYADRNNHLAQHVTKLSHEFSSMTLEKKAPPIPVRFVAIQWLLSPPHPLHKIHRLCCTRVLARGDAHQSLRADPYSAYKHETIIHRFLDQSCPPDPDLFDNIITLEVEDSLETNLAKVKAALEDIFNAAGQPLPNISAEDVRISLEKAKGYRPSVWKEEDPVEQFKIRYYALAPEIELAQVVDAALSNDADATEGFEFWNMLKSTGRVISKPHITIVHETEVALEKEDVTNNGTVDSPGPHQLLWTACVDLIEEDKARQLSGEANLAQTFTLFNFRLTHIVWNDRVMTFVVTDLGLSTASTSTPLSSTALTTVTDHLSKSHKTVHITIGTRDAEVPPYEAKGLVSRWRDGNSNEGEKIFSVEVKEDCLGSGRLRGMN